MMARWLAIGLLAIGLLGAATAEDDVGAQVRSAQAAAQGLQGSLDGRWVLADAAGRPLFYVALTSPADGGQVLGAWRSPGAHGAEGYLYIGATQPDRLEARLGEATIRLAATHGRWRGVLERRGVRTRVTLHR